MNDSPRNVLRLGTRGSLLAKAQSRMIADALEAAHDRLRVELTIVKTTGDRITDRPLHEFGGKGLFTKELEQALLAGEIDFAVHSYKDVPVTMPLVEQSDLIIAAVPQREDPRDVAVMRDPARGALPPGAVVGTSSLRRRCQILAAAPETKIEPLRGNIDTRIRKLREGAYDVIVLAMAGLRRAGLFDQSFMAPADLLPAPGQGALALQCRRSDAATRGLLGALHDPTTAACVEAERELVRLLRGDCHSPIAALATKELTDGTVTLKAAVGARDGVPPVMNAAASGSEPRETAARVFEILQSLGVDELLHGTTQP